MTSGAQ